MHTFFLGKEACMLSKYDANTRAKAGRLGMTPETLRKWIRQAEAGEGTAAGTSTAESVEVRELKRKNRELEQTIEILKAATSFFARERPRQRLACR
jgi:transposase